MLRPLTERTSGAVPVPRWRRLCPLDRRAPKRLVGFEEVWLNPGEKRLATITIDPAATNHPLCYWDVAAQKWVIASGGYQLYVGNSAAASISSLLAGRRASSSG